MKNMFLSFAKSLTEGLIYKQISLAIFVQLGVRFSNFIKGNIYFFHIQNLQTKKFVIYAHFKCVSSPHLKNCLRNDYSKTQLIHIIVGNYFICFVTKVL